PGAVPRPRPHNAGWGSGTCAVRVSPTFPEVDAYPPGGEVDLDLGTVALVAPGQLGGAVAGAEAPGVRAFGVCDAHAVASHDDVAHDVVGVDHAHEGSAGRAQRTEDQL